MPVHSSRSPKDKERVRTRGLTDPTRPTVYPPTSAISNESGKYERRRTGVVDRTAEYGCLGHAICCVQARVVSSISLIGSNECVRDGGIGDLQRFRCCLSRSHPHGWWQTIRRRTRSHSVCVEVDRDSTTTDSTSVFTRIQTHKTGRLHHDMTADQTISKGYIRPMYNYNRARSRRKQ